MSATVNSADTQGEEATCKCDRGLACNVMHAVGVATGALIILNAILTLMQSPTVPDAILAVYLVILGALGILAELRVVRVLRNAMFAIMKYVYFLTNYTARGMFWIFLGSVSYGTNIINYVAFAAGIADGVLLMVMNCYWSFPVWTEPQIIKMQTEKRLRWERDEAQRKLLAAQSASANATPRSSDAMSMPDVRSTKGPSVPDYEPPRI